MFSIDHSYPADEDRITPWVLSLGLHVLIGLGLIWLYRAPVVSEPTSIETVLVSAGEFAEIEGLIQDSVSAAAARGDDSPTPPVGSTTTSPAVQDYNAELAARQAAFEAQMAQYAAELDAEIEAQMAAHEAAVREMARQEQQAVRDSKKAEQNHALTVQQNRAELDKARERRDQIIKEAEQAARRQGGTSGSLSDGKAPTNDAPQAGGTGAARTSASTSGGGGSANDLAGRVARHIYPHWQVPSNANGERLTAQVRVDGSGNVLSVSVSGGSEALRASLEQAIRSSSPITPLQGTEVRSLRVAFVAQ